MLKEGLGVEFRFLNRALLLVFSFVISRHSSCGKHQGSPATKQHVRITGHATISSSFPGVHIGSYHEWRGKNNTKTAHERSPMRYVLRVLITGSFNAKIILSEPIICSSCVWGHAAACMPPARASRCRALGLYYAGSLQIQGSSFGPICWFKSQNSKTFFSSCRPL